ncbi:hypothetical protein MKX07_007251 [Trichoderma sp. CBMAI-0711]|nr:hypothetical protein MKX07_007251 [Trichoderma sp. CBMAI-0711]
MNQTSEIRRSRDRIKRRACVTCTKAKAKCEPRTDNLCHRCARLGKQCVYLDLPERKRKRKDEDSRVDALEGRIEELTAQLRAIRSGQSTVTTSSVSQDETTTTTTTNSSSSLHQSTLHDPADGNQDPLDADSDCYHGRPPPTTSILEGIPDIVDRGFLTTTEAEALVTRFKSSFVPNFPFVTLPTSQSAHHLRQHEPLLFLAVAAAVIPSAHPIRKLLADETMQHVTSRIVAGSERNLGLLRALLVLCAWYRYPAQKGNVQLVLLLDLCVTMAYDLRLHRKRGGLTMDEQRTLLGTYWVSTICIRPMILTQSFISAVDASFKGLEDEEDGALQQESFVRVMVGANLRPFDALKATLDEELSKCPDYTANIFRCTMHYINMVIRDTALHDESLTQQPPSSTNPSSFATSPFRASLLWHLLRHSKALINAYVAIPDAQLPQITVFTLAQLCASLVILPRAVSALLKLVVSNHSHNNHYPANSSSSSSSSSSLSSAAANQVKVRGDGLSEAQAVIDEADYINVVARLYDKLKVLLEGLSAQEKGLDVAGTLCCHMGILASWYAPRVKAILGVDLVGRNPLADMTPPPPPAAGRDDVVTAVAPAMQHVPGQHLGGGELLDEQRGYYVPGAYYYAGGTEEGGYLFNDEMWSSVLENLTGFG